MEDDEYLLIDMSVPHAEGHASPEAQPIVTCIHEEVSKDSKPQLPSLESRDLEDLGIATATLIDITPDQMQTLLSEALDLPDSPKPRATLDVPTTSQLVSPVVPELPASKPLENPSISETAPSSPVPLSISSPLPETPSSLLMTPSVVLSLPSRPEPVASLALEPVIRESSVIPRHLEEATAELVFTEVPTFEVTRDVTLEVKQGRDGMVVRLSQETTVRLSQDASLRLSQDITFKPLSQSSVDDRSESWRTSRSRTGSGTSGVPRLPLPSETDTFEDGTSYDDMIIPFTENDADPTYYAEVGTELSFRQTVSELPSYSAKDLGAHSNVRPPKKSDHASSASVSQRRIILPSKRRSSRKVKSKDAKVGSRVEAKPPYRQDRTGKAVTTKAELQETQSGRSEARPQSGITKSEHTQMVKVGLVLAGVAVGSTWLLRQRHQQPR